MIVNTVRIISYFKEDSFLEKRLEAHKKQVSFFIEQGLRVVILSIMYKPEWYISHPLVEYIDQSYKTLPGSSRNRLLEDFYSTDEDYGCFADNDSFWQSREKYVPSGVSIVDHLKSGVIDVDMFVPIDGASTPYTETLNDPEQKRSVLFCRSPNFRGCLFFLKNLKKHYGFEQYFDSRFEQDGQVIPGEDSAFGFELVSKGYKAFRCNSLVLKEYMRDASTWCTPEVRLERNKKMNTLLSEIFDFKVKPNGGLCYKTFFDKHKLPKYYACSFNSDDELTLF